MEIRPLQDGARPAYDQLARRHGTLFNTLDWLELFGAGLQLLGLYEDGGELAGGLAIYQERRWGCRIYRRAPFTPTCGPFLEVKAQNPVAVLEKRRKALECMAAWLDRQAPAVCMLPLDRSISDALPFFWRGFKVVPQYTYLLDLAAPWDQLRKNMAPDRRNDISKAQRDGLTVRPAEDLREVRDLVLATFNRQDKALNEASLEAVLFRYAKPGNFYAYVTCRDNQPIAACGVVHDAHTAYYVLGGYRAADRHHGAGALAVAEAIRRAQELGLQTFDFEGSVIPPIERFFRGFGGRLTAYLTVNKAWLPVELMLKIRRRNLF